MLVNFTVLHEFAMLAARVFGQDGAPKGHRALVVLEFRDFPAAGEAAKDQIGGVTADAQTPFGGDDEKFGKPKIDLVALPDGRAAHHGEAGRLLVLENHQRVGAVIAEPTRQQIRLAVAELAEHRKNAGVHADPGQVIEIFAKDALDPLPSFRRMTGIANGDGH